MPLSSLQDPHGILDDMHKNGSYVTDSHIVYKAGTHGETYLDKDEHLKYPEAREKVIRLLAENIPTGSIIIGPETRSHVVLGEKVAHLTGSRFIPTQKINDTHTFPENITSMLRGNRPRILIDDILNNGETLSQVQKALGEIGLTLDELHVMVDRNPHKTNTLGIPVTSLAAVDMPQWHEEEVPENIKNKSITTKLGKARNWTPKRPGEFIAVKFFLERLAKQYHGFTFDDDLEVIQMNTDEFFFQKKTQK